MTSSAAKLKGSSSVATIAITRCLGSRLFRKHLHHRLQITISVQIIRLQVAGLRPFVPAVDSNKRRSAGIGIDIRFAFRKGSSTFSVLPFTMPGRNSWNLGLLSYPIET